jgi:hypothetical protein
VQLVPQTADDGVEHRDDGVRRDGRGVDRDGTCTLTTRRSERGRTAAATAAAAG